MNDEDSDFEDEVRRIARARWPSAARGGAAIVDGRERDGVFETEECIHLVEATTSRRLDKAKIDVGKLATLAASLQKKVSSKAVRCWFVTRDEPTPDQRQTGDKHRSFLTITGFAQFQSALIDSRAYLAARDDYPFGSVRDPLSGGAKPAVEYIDIAFSEPSTSRLWTPDEVAALANDGGHALLLGDYGAGKSMTLRHVYRLLATKHKKGLTSRFPVHINLRDHYGQSEPTEVLERHARRIGFGTPSHLVRAWRAGYIQLLLDGFDEITTVTIQGLWRKLRDNRYRAMEIIRRLISEHPPGVGLLLAGRAHFFDSEVERQRALGLHQRSTTLSLNEFSDEQLQAYLRHSHLSGTVPEWLPSRPLLVAYLAATGLLSQVVGEWAAGLAPAEGWNLLLTKIADREAQIEAGIDGPTVRRILERLATKARSATDGLGPLTTGDIVAAFGEICGYAPDERGMLLLQRLPGLGVDHGESETRRFVDVAFAEACRAGDVVAFIENPYDMSSVPQNAECGAGSMGVSIAALRTRANGFGAGKVTSAADRASALGYNYLTSDLALVAMEAGIELGSAITIKDVLVRDVDLGSGAAGASRIHFEECLFGEIGLDAEVRSDRLPHFTRCFIAAIEGRVSTEDLPPDVFEECDIEEFTSAASTTNDILQLPISLGARVLITVLKKLFERKGRGRRENALYRGLDYRSRRLVPDVLQLVKSYGIAYPCRMGTETVWLPDRTAQPRAGRIIASPSAKDDGLVKAAGELA